MIDVAKQWWKGFTAKLTRRHDDATEPKVQLEQAITEAQNQHKRLKDQATNVIANQKQAEIRLNTKLAELERLNVNARQALLMASDAQRVGDNEKAAQYTQAAEALADKLISVEADFESLKRMVLDSTEAADGAKTAVKTNSRLLQEKLAEKSKLLSQLEQAKMQEEMNAAMAQLSETVGADVPTLDEVEQKIDERYARATAAGPLETTNVESQILEIEEASGKDAAHQRLEELREELGLTDDAPVETPAPD
jgi:phage shock protein A